MNDTPEKLTNTNKEREKKARLTFRQCDFGRQCNAGQGASTHTEIYNHGCLEINRYDTTIPFALAASRPNTGAYRQLPTETFTVSKKPQCEVHIRFELSVLTSLYRARSNSGSRAAFGPLAVTRRIKRTETENKNKKQC